MGSNIYDENKISKLRFSECLNLCQLGIREWNLGKRGGHSCQNSVNRAI